MKRVNFCHYFCLVAEAMEHALSLSLLRPTFNFQLNLKGWCRRSSRQKHLYSQLSTFLHISETCKPPTDPLRNKYRRGSGVFDVNQTLNFGHLSGHPRLTSFEEQVERESGCATFVAGPLVNTASDSLVHLTKYHRHQPAHPCNNGTPFVFCFTPTHHFSHPPTDLSNGSDHCIPRVINTRHLCTTCVRASYYSTTSICIPTGYILGSS